MLKKFIMNKEIQIKFFFKFLKKKSKSKFLTNSSRGDCNIKISKKAEKVIFKKLLKKPFFCLSKKKFFVNVLKNGIFILGKINKKDVLSLKTKKGIFLIKKNNNDNISNNFSKKLLKKLYRNFKIKEKYSENLFFNSLNNLIFFKLITLLQKKGKRNKSIALINNLFNFLRKKYYYDPFSILLYCFLRIKPLVGFKKKKIAGKIHNIPISLSKHSQILYSIKLFLKSVSLRNERSILNRITSEVYDILLDNNNSISLKKRKELHVLASENKYYIRFL